MIVGLEFIAGMMLGVEFITKEEFFDDETGWILIIDLLIVRIMIEK
jgi:hypothetical protein